MEEYLPDRAMRRVPVVLNESAGLGHGEKAYDEIRRLFARHGIEADIRTARGGSGLEAQAREALRADPAILVAAGGDGTVSAIASLLPGTRTALGILPLGTLNHFARDLGLPLALDAAVEAIAQGEPVAVDVGEVNGRAFVNNASLGIYPDIVRDRIKRQQRLGHGKYWAMLWATLKVLGRSPFLRLGLELDGHALRCRSPFVFVGNNDYVMQGFHIGQRASVRDGRLSVYTTRRIGRLPLLALAMRALFGRLRQADDFSSARAQRVLVESSHRRLLVATDGEVTALDTPLEFRVLPGGLRVLLPKDRA
jgi:YegS/Rv2252/BmrU family lipid kinase